METKLRRALECLAKLENRRQRQNVRIGLKEGMEGREQRLSLRNYEKLLGIEGDRVRIERGHCTGPPLRPGGNKVPRAVLVRQETGIG